MLRPSLGQEHIRHRSVATQWLHTLCSYLQHIHAHVYSAEQQKSPRTIVTDVYNTNCKIQHHSVSTNTEKFLAL